MLRTQDTTKNELKYECSVILAKSDSKQSINYSWKLHINLNLENTNINQNLEIGSLNFS